MAKITENFFRNTVCEKFNKELEWNKYDCPSAEELYAHFLKSYSEEERNELEEYADNVPDEIYHHIAMEYLYNKLDLGKNDWIYEEMFVEGTVDNTYYKTYVEGKKRPWED